ncbi:uncharacterized protein cubi_02481 [Cryptosporidium ubiquitum]|uniref:Importin N-terminal domain-containing protein n=1 Tax=Cryptosporidium ubiquitum TaxID=857276 RepID=A0A1J4MGA4_9CRYT|nr:uncharacterized protein cubi_02481 [Cryptosporidium ubiquitum]OII73249.1 hypothetical protein cubi_02481 [Cryptosporidium ubiquitum]
MSFTRELVHLKILELWTSGDSLKRAEANKYLLEFKDSSQAWQICSELLEMSTEPEVKYVAAQTLCQKVSNCQSEVNAIGGPKVIFEQIYLRSISDNLRNGSGGNLMSQLLSKLGEGLSYLIILGISDGSWIEGFESCLRISQPYFVGQGTGLELWMILNTLRYIPDAGVLLESQKRPMLIQSTLPRILDFLSESITKVLSDSSGNHGGNGNNSGASENQNMNQKLLELSLDILVEYFEKFEIPLFTHSPLSLAISNLLKSDICVAPYRLAELFVRGLPRCSFYMQKQGIIGDSNSIFTLIEDVNGLHVLLKFPSEAETAVMMSLLNYLKLLYDKLRQIPLPINNNNCNNNNCNNNCNNNNNNNNNNNGNINNTSNNQGTCSVDNSQMIRINTWSTLKMNVPQIDLDEDTERSILSWSGVIFSLLEGYSTIFIIGELPEVKNRCNSNNKILDNPLSFLPEMLSLLLMLHVRIPGVLVNMWCTLRDLVNEGVITKDHGLSIAKLLITPAIQSLATQCRTDFFYWEKLGINENSIMNARISTYSNFGLKELTLDDSVEEFLDFLDTATLHINDIYFFLSALGPSHGQAFVTYIQHSLLSCSNEKDPIGCVVFLRFSDTLIEATNSLQGTISNILELACTTLPKTQSCIYQITLLLQKSAHLLVNHEHAPIWLLSLKYLIEISQQSNLLLLSSTFEELCQLGVDHVVNNPNCDQILLELSQSVIQVVTSKLQFSNDINLYGNISMIDENIGFVGGYVHILCYTMIKNNQSIQVLAEALKSFLYHMIHSTIEQIPQVYSNTSFSNSIDIGVVPQCCWIWSIYVFLKILKSFTFCIENNNYGNICGFGLEYGGGSPKMGVNHFILGSNNNGICGNVNNSNVNNSNGNNNVNGNNNNSNNNDSNNNNNINNGNINIFNGNNNNGVNQTGLSSLTINLTVLIRNLFSPQDQQMLILGEKLRSLLFNSFNLKSESQGYGVVLISSMMYQYSRNISLHNLMICTRRSFTGNESCLSCPKDVIVSICCLILRIISCTWSANFLSMNGNGDHNHVSSNNTDMCGNNLGNVSNDSHHVHSGNPIEVNQGNQWCTWEFTYSNIKQSLLHLKNELENISNDERASTLIVRQRHGCCTMILHEIIKRLPIESRDNLVNMMHNDGIDSLLYEFWIKKFCSITNVEISRSFEPFFMWQISLLGNCNNPTLSVQLVLSSQYLASSLDMAVRSLQFNDKYLLNSVLIYLTRLSTAIHSFSQIHHIWNEQLGRLLMVLFSVYNNFEKNTLLQMCKFVSTLLEYFPNNFFMTLNGMFSPDFSRIHPEIGFNPFKDTNQQQQNMIIICFKSLKGGPRLRQFLLEISNVTNGISSMDDCLKKFEVLLNYNNLNNTVNVGTRSVNSNGGASGSNGNPIIIS